MALPECGDMKSRPKGTESSPRAESVHRAKESAWGSAEFALGLSLPTAPRRTSRHTSQDLSLLIWEASRSGCLRWTAIKWT